MGHVVISEVDKTFEDLIGQLGQGVWFSKIPRSDVVLQIVIVPLRYKDHTLCMGGTREREREREREITLNLPTRHHY